MDAERTSAPNRPLEASLLISPHDVVPFLWGRCSQGKLEDLLWGFTLIDWGKPGLKRINDGWKEPLSEYPLSRTWGLLKLLLTPNKVRGIPVRNEPRLISLLQAGRIKEACDLAIRRSGQWFCRRKLKY